MKLLKSSPDSKCRIGKNGILGFLASSVLKGGGTEISRDKSVPRRISSTIKTAFFHDDFKLSLRPSLLPFPQVHLLYQPSMTNNQSAMCSKVAQLAPMNKERVHQDMAALVMIFNNLSEGAAADFLLEAESDSPAPFSRP